MKKGLFIISLLCFAWAVNAVSLQSLQSELDSLIAQLADLQRYFTPQGTIVIPVVSTAQQGAQNQLLALVNPLQIALSGSGRKGGDTMVTGAQVTAYTQAFNAYTKTYGTTGDGYKTLAFWNVFLPLVAAKNTLYASLKTLKLASADQLTAGLITPSLLDQAQTYQDNYTGLQAFLSSAIRNGFSAPVPLVVLNGYRDFATYAQTILSFKEQVLNPQTPTVIGLSADKFILNNFSDAKLVTLSVAQMQQAVTAFKGLYTSSDTYYAAYQLWAAYVPLRYNELQLLATQTKKAATNFIQQYNASFRSAFVVAGNNSALQAPYTIQYTDMYTEFQVVLQLANVIRAQ